MINRLFTAAIAALFLSTVTANAQTPAPPLSADDAFVLTMQEEGDGNWTVTWEVQPGYYLYRSMMTAEDAQGVAISLPLREGETYDDPWMGQDDIYRDPVSTQISATRGPITLHWQGCQQDGVCYAPQKTTLISQAPPNDQSASRYTATSGGGTTATSNPIKLSSELGIVTGLAERGGAALVVLGFFSFGLLLAVTPCVLPMIPIVAGMLTRQDGALTARRGLVLTGAYVLAMASAFGLLGVVAAWSGANLQVMMQSPIAIGGIAVIFVILALSMFGLFDIRLPSRWSACFTPPGGSKKVSVLGAAGLGFGSALIVGPCVTAPLAGALLYIAQTGDVFLGAAALFALGLGQGVPLMAVGAFGPKILPRRGAWMNRVRLVFGVIFLGLAIWLAGRLLTGPIVLALWAVLLIGCGVTLGALDRLTADSARGARVAATLGVLFLFGGFVQGFGSALGADDPVRPLAPLAARINPNPEPAQTYQTVSTAAELKRALTQIEEIPALIYVTADWCVVCRAIERGPMADPDVLAAMQNVALIKVDVTHFDTEAQALMASLSAVGPPTMIFVDAARIEADESRQIGDITAASLLASIQKVLP